jgi:hypothetical protein
LSDIISESDLFSQDNDEDLLDHEWLASEKNPVDVRNRLYEIFLERSSILFAVTEQTNTLVLWIKQTIGFLLNKIEDGEDSSYDRESLLATIVSLV